MGMTPPTVEQLLAKMNAAGFVVFDNAFDLNLIALRAVPNTVNAFDDLLCCLYRDEAGLIHLHAWRCTTEPGRPALEHPSRADGTAVIALGQHRAAYTFGLHHQQYPCLVPCRPIPVMRDKDGDAEVDDSGGASTSSTVQIHRANPTRASSVVDRWSEGCLVIADPHDFDKLMLLAHEQVKHGHGDRFTLSVMEWAPQAAELRRAVGASDKEQA